MLSPIYGRCVSSRGQQFQSKKKPDLLSPQECREAQRQIRILEAIADRPGITVSEIAQQINESPFLIRKALTDFLEDKSVYRVGQDTEDTNAQYFLRPIEGFKNVAPTPKRTAQTPQAHCQ